MTIDQAATIAVNCIKVVGNFSGPMQPQDQLGTLGITGQPRINGLRNRIVNDGSIGVPSVNHSLNAAFLQQLASDWTVIQLTLVINNNSVSTAAREPELRAQEALDKAIRKVEG